MNRQVHSSLVILLIMAIGLTAFKVVKLTNDGWWFLSVPHGKLVGEFEGVKIFTHSKSVRGAYGMKYQCVEFVNRFYAKRLGHKNMTRMGHADSYFWDVKKKGLVAYPNGGKEPPRKYDILIFDGGNHDGEYGHVGIISKVDFAKGEVEIFQQNAKMRTMYGLLVQSIPKATLRLIKQMDGGWFIQSGKAHSLPVAGWSRRLSRNKSPAKQGKEKS